MRIEGLAPRGGKHEEWRACQLEIEQTVLGSRDIFRQEEKGVSGGQMIDGGETTITNILLLSVSVLANLLLVRALIRGNEPVPRSAMYQFRQSGHQRRQPERRTGGRARADGKPLSLPNDRRPRFPSLSFLEDSLIKMGPSN